MPDTSAAPTTNAELPAPAAAPATTTHGKESARPRPTTEAAATRLTAGNITPAPYRSVSTPTGNRTNAATNTGNPTRARYQPVVTPNRSCRCGPRSIEALRFSPKPTVTSASVIPARGEGCPEKVIANTPDPSRAQAHPISRPRRIQARTRMCQQQFRLLIRVPREGQLPGADRRRRRRGPQGGAAARRAARERLVVSPRPRIPDRCQPSFTSLHVLMFLAQQLRDQGYCQPIFVA